MKYSNPLSPAAIVMAAGKGTRMKSDLPKVLHNILGRPMLSHVLSVLKEVGVQDVCLILNPQTEPFLEFLNNHGNLTICIQKQQRGTADAVASCAVAFPEVKSPSYANGELFHGKPLTNRHILICCGDTPALNPDTLREFVDACVKRKCPLGVIGIEHPKPTGYGRLIVDQNHLLKCITEEKDADEATKKVRLINTGFIFAETSFLFELLSAVTPANAQKEYYLTDCFALAYERGQPAYVYTADEITPFSGINTPEQLKDLENWLIKNRVERCD